LDAISNSGDSAVRLNDIHYQMLKHLPSEALYTCQFTWRNSYIIPTLKPG